MRQVVFSFLAISLVSPLRASWPSLAFEPNRGQADPQVQFLSRGEGYGLFLTGREAILALRGPSSPAVLRIQFDGASIGPRGGGVEPLASRSHYFIGRDPRLWRTGVPNYSRVRFAGVYPGIDVVYYGSHGRLEFDFVIAPGADPSHVRIRFSGAKRVRTGTAGDLLIETSAGVVRQLRPHVTQDGRSIRAAYVLHNDRSVGLRIGHYNTAHGLRIDPVLVYASYLGGNSAVTGGSDYGRAVAVDTAGNIYVAGGTEAADFPVTADAAQQKSGGGFDAFLVKLDPAGNCLYSTYLGGEGRDEAFGVAVDSAGNAYVAGATNSSKFPTTSGAAQSALSGYSNTFVAKIDPVGAVVYSTLLGGEGVDSAAAIAVDGSGAAYVAGSTTSKQFPVTAGAFQQKLPFGQSAFVAKLAPSGAALVYATYLGGTIASQSAAALAVDASGSAYVAGQTSSRDFPVTPDAYRKGIFGQDAFIAKLNDSGTTLLYSTLLGGSGADIINSVAIDPAGNAYVGGSTSSPNLPVTKNAMQAKFGGGPLDGFLAELNDKGTALLYCTYLGGTARDAANAVALHPDGSIYAAGETQSQDFPASTAAMHSAYGGGTADGFVVKWNAEMAPAYSTFLGGDGEDRILAIALDPGGGPRLAGYTASSNFPCASRALRTDLARGGYDAILAGLDPAGTSLLVSTYLGGSGYSTDERATDMVVDRDGAAYITGQTMSTNFPAVSGAVQPTRGGGVFGDAFVAKVAPDGKSLVWATYLGGSGSDVGSGLSVDASGSAYVVGTTASADFPTTPGAFQTALKGAGNAFVAKLSPDGASLPYATLLGAWQDSGAGIAVLADGTALVAGSTYATNFLVTSGAFQTRFAGLLDAFVAKLSADGSTLVYSTLLGGENSTTARSIAADGSGNAYIAGVTSSPNFPVTAGAFQTSLAGPSDAFVAKLDASGSSLLYATLLGGSGSESANRIVVDSTDSAFVAGSTGSTNFPVTGGASQSAYGGGGDAFIARLKPDGSALAYSTYLGGVTGDGANGLAVDPAGNAYVTGSTNSFVFPSTPGRFQTGLNGHPDAFLAKLDAYGKTLLFSSQYGFSGGSTVGNAIAVDGAGKVYIAGQTTSPGLRTTPGAFQPSAAGPASAFIAKFDLDAPTPPPTLPTISKVIHYVTGLTPVCGGAIVIIEGTNLATDTLEHAKPLDKLSGNLPTKLGTTVVRFGVDARAIPLFSVSPDKIVAQLPYAALDTAGEMTVSVGSDTSKPYRPELYGAAFGIFGVYKPDLSTITQTNLVKPGDTIVAYVTGFGKTNPSVPTGAPAPSDSDVAVRFTEMDPYVSLVQGDIDMKSEITAFTLVPGTVGVAQATIRIGEVASDEQQWDLVFRSSGSPSNKVRIWIQSSID